MVGEKNVKKEFEENGTVVKFTITCPLCNLAQNPIRVAYKDYEDWIHGSLIQNAFPYLTTEERELLVSGTCDPCWSDLVDGL